MIKLTAQEHAAATALLETSPATIWGLKVYQVVRGGTDEDIRNLIQQLQTEGLANPSCMEDILGEEAWTRVLEVDYLVEDMIDLSHSCTV